MDLTTWDIYFAGLVAMTLHPGFQRPDVKKPSIFECANIADEMLKEKSCRG